MKRFIISRLAVSSNGVIVGKTLLDTVETVGELSGYVGGEYVIWDSELETGVML
jgi:hypothetical protein